MKKEEKELIIKTILEQPTEAKTRYFEEIYDFKSSINQKLRERNIDYEVGTYSSNLDDDDVEINKIFENQCDKKADGIRANLKDWNNFFAKYNEK